MKWAILTGILCSLSALLAIFFLVLSIIEDSGRYAGLTILSCLLVMITGGITTFIITEQIDKE